MAAGKQIDLLKVSSGAESAALELAAEGSKALEHPFPKASFQASGNVTAILAQLRVPAEGRSAED